VLSSDRFVTVTPSTAKEVRPGRSCLTGIKLGMAAVLYALLLLLLLPLLLWGADVMRRVLTLPLSARTLSAAPHCCVLSLPETFTCTAGTWSKQRVAWRQLRSCCRILSASAVGPVLGTVSAGLPCCVLGPGPAGWSGCVLGFVLGPERRRVMLGFAWVALLLTPVLIRRKFATSQPFRRSTIACGI
jgi:hypothetical protein